MKSLTILESDLSLSDIPNKCYAASDPILLERGNLQTNESYSSKQHNLLAEIGHVFIEFQLKITRQEIIKPKHDIKFRYSNQGVEISEQSIERSQNC